jgi:hypothetical protein
LLEGAQLVRITRVSVAFGAALALMLVVAPPAPAPVPPRDCGMLEVRAKRYNIKADQIRCRTARTYAKAYLRYSRKPSGYRCRDYGRGTSIEFRCSKGDKVLFAIRR